MFLSFEAEEISMTKKKVSYLKETIVPKKVTSKKVDLDQRLVVATTGSM